jgi:hypothetical protein
MTKKGSKENPVSSEELASAVAKIKTYQPSVPDRSYRILNATLKDGFVNYTYEITEGVGLGDIHSVKGKGIIKDDLSEAWSEVNIHLALMDDIFKIGKVKYSSISEIKVHEYALLFNLTGFKISGAFDSESIILTGTKYIKGLGRLDIETPKVALDNLSSYKQFADLKYVIDWVRDEVSLYKEGKYTPVETEDHEDQANPKQISMLDGIGNDNDDFEKAKV